MSWIDHQLGRLLGELKASGLENDTLVVLHSDHGWSLGEVGQYEKFTCTETGTRVPLFVRTPWLPGTANRTLDTLVELVDVYPSVSELAGIDLPPGEALDGQSFAPLLAEPGVEGPREEQEWALSVFPRCPSNASVAWKVRGWEAPP